MIKSIFIIIILFLSVSILKATIINVPIDQPTIQAGIDSASTGDTVLVQPGLYNENIYFNGKNISVGSLYLMSNDTSFISQTIIDGNNLSSSVVWFFNGVDSSAVLIGFTLQGGYGQPHPTGFYSSGGGIYCNNSGPTLKKLIIRNNTRCSDGGGIFYQNSIVRLYDSIINDNHVHGFLGGVGGGTFLSNSSGIIKNVIFKNNSATYLGGTIWSYNSNFRLQHVTCINNTGNSIECQDNTRIEIVNSIFWNVSPPIINFIAGSPPNLVTVIHSDFQGGINSIQTNNNGSVHWLDGNIDLYPQFMDTSVSNFILSATSPCIDAGIQDTFIVYNNDQDTINIAAINFLGTAPDMGAYEFDPATHVSNEPILIKNYILFQNYPNPFNPTTTIKYTLPKSDQVTIEVFNLLGQKITTLLDKQMTAGNHEVKFTADNLPSGVYLYHIQAGQYQEVRKMILIK
jgi:type IX secretion system substrate protein